tara:strand:- start:954 stop:1958 length:1005 start_codon:yes stop_codon:yes gene_type:complete
MKIGYLIFSKLLPSIIVFLGIPKNTWRFEKINIFLQSVIMIPLKRIRGIRRTRDFVEKQYDDISGTYIQDNYYNNRKRFSIVNGQIKKISTIDNMKFIREEIRQILSEYKFNNILEIGAGELTTLEDIFKFKNSKIDCYGIDLSLNRLAHGVNEFKKRHSKIPYVAKANATKLPFPDNSFDLVITRHTLEQMPQIFKFSIDEIIRVSKKHIVFFEPSFELGSLTQKVKMLNSDYVRGIPKYLSTKSFLTLSDTFLMKNSANPLNHTACTKIEIKDEAVIKSNNKDIPFVCPNSKEILKVHSDFLFAESSNMAYPIINGIPILDEINSFKLSKLS